MPDHSTDRIIILAQSGVTVRQAVAAFPEFGFVWAVRRGPGDWEITRHA